MNGPSLHVPAVGLQTPVMPAFYFNPLSGEIEYGNAEARRVLERPFLYMLSHDEDLEANLALLGIGLHTLQDSFKHCGYSAARGHIGADPDPDHACCNLDTTLLSAEMTLNSLRYARRLVTGSSATPPKDWKKRLRAAFTAGEGRWARFVGDQFRQDYPSLDRQVERWKQAGGEEAFDRAVDRAKETLLFLKK